MNSRAVKPRFPAGRAQAKSFRRTTALPTLSQPHLHPLPILVSAAARQSEGAAIEAAVFAQTGGQRHVQWVTPDDLQQEPQNHASEIAYITRDVTAGSTKDLILPATERFYACMRAAPNLAWVHTHSSGADRYIFGEMRSRGVRVTTSTGTNAEPVAQTALAAVLMLGRQFLQLLAAQRQQQWKPLLNRPDVHDLRGRTAMVVGLGPVGQEIARLLKAVGMTVVGVTRNTNSAHPVGDAGAKTALDGICTYGDMPQHLSRSDYLVLACPLSPLTRHLVNAEALARLPRGAFLVNVARGEVVAQNALLQALQSRQLAGAFLDVFEPEPLAADSPLWQLPNVMVSPHTAGHFAEHAQRVHQLFIHNLQGYLKDEPLRNEFM